MKSGLRFTFFFLSIALIIGSLSFTRGKFEFKKSIINEIEYQNIISEREESEIDLLTQISFNNLPLFYDKLSGSWFYSVPADNSNLNPSVSFSSTDKQIQIAFTEKIIPGKSIRFIAYTPSIYREYTLVATTLPLIKIACSDEFLSIMDFEWEKYPGRDIREERFPMTFTLRDNRPGTLQPLITSEGSIHIRGASTANFPKKGFRLTLYEKGTGKEQHEYNTSLLGLRNDGDWLLYAAYNDPEKIRNVFSSNLWKRSCGSDNSFHIDFGMEYRFTELFINEEYWGLYALGYPIDARQVNIYPDSLGHYEEFLFKQQAFGPKTHNVEAGFDGLILENEDASESDMNNGLLIMKMYFAQLENNAAGGTWYNDLNNILDSWLLMKLGQAYDTVRIKGMTKNIMIAIKKSDTGRKILYAPWDMDAYWGNICVNDVENLIVPYALDVNDNSYEFTVNPISVLRERDSSVVKQIQDRYFELRAGGWSEQVIDEMIDGFELDIFGSGAYIRDMERWPDGNYQSPDLGLTVFREYVHGRLASMDEYIKALDTE